MVKDPIREALAFSDLTPEEKQQRGILGRLYGPIADTIRPTRNGRAYSDELWENVFEHNEIVKEMLANGGIPGELDHPADRQELCSEKIAIIMPEKPKKDKDGHLIGYFDIQDTPCGRIVYQLAKYGYKLGISSRGNGDVLDDDSVDPNTYEFTCFDIVIVPSVKDARLKMTESLDTNMLNMKKALSESLENSDAYERKVMEETLNDLKIDLKESEDVVIGEAESGEIKEECNSENCTDTKLAEGQIQEQTDDDKQEASNVGSDGLVESLQEALKEKSTLETKVQSLQSELAVSNTKVNELNEELKKYKASTVRLSTMVKSQLDLSKKVSDLEESLKVKDTTIKSQEDKINELTESKNSETANTKTLTESISSKDSKITELNESLNKVKAEYEVKIHKLTESYNREKEVSDNKISELTKQVADSKKLGESYKGLANQVVNKYIDTKAHMLGVTSNEIKNKLPKRYSLSDIDTICESLRKYEVNVNKLPFDFNKQVKGVSVKPSVNESLKPENPLIDDEVDDSLLRLAKNINHK